MAALQSVKSLDAVPQGWDGWLRDYVNVGFPIHKHRDFLLRAPVSPDGSIAARSAGFSPDGFFDERRDFCCEKRFPRRVFFDESAGLLLRGALPKTGSFSTRSAGTFAVMTRRFFLQTCLFRDESAGLFLRGAPVFSPDGSFEERGTLTCAAPARSITRWLLHSGYVQ